MNKSLLDTDILSEILKHKNLSITSKATAYRQRFSFYTLSSVTVMEVVRGFHAAKRPEKLEEFRMRLSQVEILPFTTAIADLAGQIDADLATTGRTIGRADPMIAATAIYHQLVLVTGNTEHFARIQQLGYALLLDNWRTS